MSNTTPENIMDEPIPASFRVPTMVPTTPTTTSPTRVKLVAQKFKQFNDWIVSMVPKPIKRTVSDKLKALKKTISNILSNKNLTPREIESALKGVAKTFRIKGGSENYKDFLQKILPVVVELLNKQSKPMKVMLSLGCMFHKMGNKDGELIPHHSRTKNVIVDGSTNILDFLSIDFERIVELIETFQENGSGWVFDKVQHLDIFISAFKPLAASSYIALPKALANKKALINPKNTDDDECFKWAVTEAVYPQKDARQKITKISRKNAKLFNWEGIKFPVKLTQINLFEKNNPEYAVSVLGYSKEDGVHPLRTSKNRSSDKTDIILMLFSGEEEHHYVLVNGISRLVGMQTNKHKGKNHICLNCFNTFSIKKSLEQHEEFCQDNEAVKICMPKEGETIKFESFGKAHKVPFVITGDFESYTEKIDPTDVEYDETKSYTKKYQKHKPSGFCYYISYRGGFYKKPFVYTGENAESVFCERLEIETKEIYDKYLKNIVPLKMTRDELNRYEKTDVCHICEEAIYADGEDIKVIDHDHLTGKFVGAAHQSCNLNFKEPKFIPVVFHNLSGYDAHLFIKQLGVPEGKINCIATNEEKYTSFTKEIQVDTLKGKDGKERKVFLNNRFIDSFKFMSCGLDTLVKNLTNNGTSDLLIPHTKNRFQEKTHLTLRKGVYPYDYMDGPKKMEETKLPPKSEFYSKLSDSNISDEDYEHAQKVWLEFGMTTMKDYHDLYLELDVLLLVDVFENFREICLKNYKLDPAWYLTAPGLSWDAMLSC